MKALTKLISFVLGIVLMSSTAFAALTLPTSGIEFDLDNWTRQFNQGVPVPIGAPAAIGYESRAFLAFNDISQTVGYGGPDLPAFWTGGTGGEFLYGVERNVLIQQIVPQADGSVNLYFGHATNDPNNPAYYEVTAYLSTMDYATGFLPLLATGAANFNGIEAALQGTSTVFLEGRFASSTYLDPIAGLVQSVVGINVPFVAGQFLGGTWLNQVTTPFGMAVNTFVDINSVGYGSQFLQALYGVGPDGSQYDLAIQNVRLFSELDPEWVISDDGVRGATTTPIPEPSTLLLLGGGLLGVAVLRKRRSATI